MAASTATNRSRSQLTTAVVSASRSSSTAKTSISSTGDVDEPVNNVLSERLLSFVYESPKYEVNTVERAKFRILAT
jgi:hypothetical protein